MDTNIIVREGLEAGTSVEYRRYMLLEPRHEAQELFLISPASNVYLVGPNSIGKSPSGAMRYVMHGTHVVPFSLRSKVKSLWPIVLPGNRWGRYIVLGISRDQSEQAAWAAINEWLPPEFVHRPTHAGRRIVLKRFFDDPARPGSPRVEDAPGVTLILRTVEQKRIRGQGGQFDALWPDEESAKADVYNEYFVQVGKRAGRVQGTITPEETRKAGGNTWFGKNVLGPATVMRGGDASIRSVWIDPQTEVIFGRRGDQIDAVTGKLMAEDQIKLRIEDRLKGAPDSERRLRVDGVYEMTPERPYHPEVWVRSMSEMRKQENLVPERGIVIPVEKNGARFVPDPDWPFHVYEKPDPAEAYSVGIDCASGNAEDLTGLVAWARRSRRVAAVYHGRIEPSRFKAFALAACRWYNDAWAIPEAEKYSMDLITYMRENGYTRRLYQRRTRADDDVIRYTDYGYTTSSPAARARLDERITEELMRGALRVRFPPLEDEIRMYGWWDHSGRLRPDHPPGGHDDIQKALALALVGHDDCPLPPRPRASETEYENDTPSRKQVRYMVDYIDRAVRSTQKGGRAPEWDPMGLRALARKRERLLRS